MKILSMLLIMALAGCASQGNVGPAEDKGKWVEVYLSAGHPCTPEVEIELIAVSDKAATIRLIRAGQTFSAEEGHSFTNGLKLLRLDAAKQQVVISADLDSGL